MKKTLVCILLIYLFRSSFAGNNMDSAAYKDSSHLRACIILIDSLGMNCGGTDSVYLFKISHLNYGAAKSQEIYVCTYYQALYQFNFNKAQNHSYWWTLSRTDKEINGIAVYRHNGNY